ncbi:MAG: ribonuclease HI family protein [Planctomycetota bacterium]
MKLTIHIDGGARGNPGPAGAGVVIRDENGRSRLEAGFFLGRKTNNAAEYTALLKALEAARAAAADELVIFSDSELLVRQINGDYRVKSKTLRELFDIAFSRLREFKKWSISHVRREANEDADEMANKAMDAGADVCFVDDLRGDSTPDRAREQTEQRGDESRVVHVRCVKPPGKRVCPARCDSDTVFTFDDVVPPGICLGVAGAMLDAVSAAKESEKAVEVRCPRAECGALFEISPE